MPSNKSTIPLSKENYTQENLGKLPADTLRTMCKENRLPTSGLTRKDQLIRALLEGEVSQEIKDLKNVPKPAPKRKRVTASLRGKAAPAAAAPLPGHGSGEGEKSPKDAALEDNDLPLNSEQPYGMQGYMASDAIHLWFSCDKAFAHEDFPLCKFRGDKVTIISEFPSVGKISIITQFPLDIWEFWNPGVWHIPHIQPTSRKNDTATAFNGGSDPGLNVTYYVRSSLPVEMWDAAASLFKAMADQWVRELAHWNFQYEAMYDYYKKFGRIPALFLSFHEHMDLVARHFIGAQVVEGGPVADGSEPAGKRPRTDSPASAQQAPDADAATGFASAAEQEPDINWDAVAGSAYFDDLLAPIAAENAAVTQASYDQGPCEEQEQLKQKEGQEQLEGQEEWEGQEEQQEQNRLSAEGFDEFFGNQTGSGGQVELPEDNSWMDLINWNGN